MSLQHPEPVAGTPPTGAPDETIRQHVLEARAAYDVENYDRAIAVCERLLSQHPDSAEAFLLLGMTSWQLDEPLHAIELLRRAQSADESTREYADALATILAHLGESNESLYFAKLATILEPHPFGEDLMPERFREYFKNLNFARPHIYRTRALDALERGAFREAETLLEKQRGLTPNDPETLRLEARTAFENGKLAKAVGALESVIEDYATAPDHDLMARCLARAGYFDAALECHDTATTLRPDDPDLGQSRLRTLALRSGDGPADAHTPGSDYAEACHDWFEKFGRPAPDRPTDSPNTPDPDRVLRVGYLGSELHGRGLAPLLEPIVAQHNREAVEVYVYAGGTLQDMTTQSLMRHCQRWTSVRGTDPVTIGQILRNDGIDVAVDLTGHGADSLLRTMLHGAAPVRLGWLGTRPATPSPYDAHLLGPGPHVVPVEHPISTSLLPDTISPSPCRSNGHVTFGLVAPVAALNADTFALAQAILTALPDAHLLVANTARHDAETMSRIHSLAEAAGIADRVTVAELENPKGQRVAFFEYIDILIDPVPVGGFIESGEALWMGTPVVTLSGTRTARALEATGCDRWVYTNAASLAGGAIELARDTGALHLQRQNLRGQVAPSPLFSTASFVKHLEAAYRGHWKAWCQTRTSA